MRSEARFFLAGRVLLATRQLDVIDTVVKNFRSRSRGAFGAAWNSSDTVDEEGAQNAQQLRMPVSNGRRMFPSHRLLTPPVFKERRSEK